MMRFQKNVKKTPNKLKNFKPIFPVTTAINCSNWDQCIKTFNVKINNSGKGFINQQISKTTINLISSQKKN